MLASARPRETIRVGEGEKTERRLVTVLFADLVGFTTIAEGRDAEAVRELLSAYFELTRELLGRYGGTVEKFIGDAVMAVWGTPIAQEDDAERAVRAGLELVDRVRTLGPEITARVGILTGEAAVTIGATNQGMVAGDLVNTASRLQSAAQPGMVLIGESTQRAVSAAIVCEPAGEHVLKGKSAPVAAWRAVRVVAERGGTGRADRIEAPFVGREDELRLLKELLHGTARDGRPRLVSVMGQAGTGKSRLVWELLKYIDGLVEDIYWHDGRSPAYGDGVTFWALGEMVRVRAGLAEGDDEAVVRERIAEMLAEYVPDAEDRRWIEPSLFALLGIGDAPSGGGQELFAAWRTFFERISEKGTVALVFEDLHWADGGLLDFIETLVESSRAPVLVITMARPELVERRPGWGSGARSFTSIHLDPLPEEAMRELLAGLVPGLPAEATDGIVARAEGVPLYAVETVRMLVNDERLVETDGAYRPVGNLATLDIPHTLHALIAARLDALQPADRALLQDAAVLGQSFTLEGLEAVSGQDGAVLEPRLRALVRRELLVLDIDPRSPERGQYAFVQGLIREVAYSTLARRDRRSRHLAAARYYEALGDEELAGVLAAQYLAAQRESAEGAEADALAVQARIALTAAAERANQLGSHEQEIGFLEAALSIATDVGEQGELLRKAGSAATEGGRHEAAEGFLAQAEARYRDLGDRSALAELVALRGEALLNRAHLEPAIELLKLAVAEFGDLDDESLIPLWSQLARAHFFALNADDAIEWADRTLAAAERIGRMGVVADTMVTKGTTLVDLGRALEGRALIEGGRRLAESTGDRFAVGRAFQNLSYALSNSDSTAALENARTGFAYAQRFGMDALVASLAVNLAQESIRHGQWDDARSAVDLALETTSDPLDRAGILLYRVQLDARQGRPFSEAMSEARTVSGRHSDPQIRSELHVTEAMVALIEQRLADAVTLGLQAATELLPNAPHALRIVGRAASWMHDLEHAREARDRLAMVPMHGPSMHASRATSHAGVAALEGRADEALALYREALALWDELGLHWDHALTALDMLLLVGATDQEEQAAMDVARATFVRLDAKPFISIIEGLPHATPAGRQAEPDSVPSSAAGG
jgi:class 3 adenylate cyclase/tetratricopeptide (TPR) repeat protein